MKKYVFALLLGLAGPLCADSLPWTLYQRLSQQEGNLFFSPASIESALRMAAQGARGKTKKQFEQLLPPPTAQPTVGTNATLECANAIWADQTLPIHDAFQAELSQMHRAEFRTANFLERPDAERQTINQWVETKTHSRIRDLLPAGSVTGLTRLILINAIYFKGDWLYEFNSEQTLDAPFWTSAESCVQVPMMHLENDSLNYSEGDGFQILELPYSGRTLSMLLILPTSKTGLPHLEQCVGEREINYGIERLFPRHVSLFLPHFKLESSFPALKNDLAALGLSDAFNAQRADFSGITKQPLHISEVVHKAFVEVNEQGTEAAAATGMTMRFAAVIDEAPVVFRADRPFLFLIRDNASGALLFMGRVTQPEL